VACVGPLAATISCLLAYPGCGTEPPPEPPVPVAKFSVIYERGGGLKPMPQRLVIRPGRHAIATTASATGRSRTVRFRVSVLTIKRLRAGLDDPRFDLLESSGPGNCADCYVYSIDYRGHAVSVAQVDVPRWLSKTIERFGALAGSHRPFH
jgi:hypothetical protein